MAQRLGVEDVEPRAAVQRESPAACERNGVDVVAVHLAQPGLFQRRETRFECFLVRGPEDRRKGADEPFAECPKDLRRNAFHGQEDLIKALPCGDLRKFRKARPQRAGAAAVTLFRCRRRGSVGPEPRPCCAARVQQLGERPAPQRIERARREHISGRDIGGEVRHGKRRTAGLDKILFGARGIERSVDRLFGRIARDSAGILPVRHGERALCFRQRKRHRNADARRLLFIERGKRLEYLVGALHVVLGAIAEHGLIAFAREIPVRKAAAGEHGAERVLVVGLERKRLAAGGHNRGNVFRALHAPFDLERCDPGVRHLLRMAQQGHVLERENMVALAAAPVEPARLRAQAAVAAASAEHGGKIARARNAHAVRAVDKCFRARRCKAGGDLFHFGERQLAREDDRLAAEIL